MSIHRDFAALFLHTKEELVLIYPEFIEKTEKLLFKGNSAIYGYNGQEIQKAGPEGDEILPAEIFPAKTRDKSFNPFNDVLKDRRPRHYRPLVEP